MIQQKEWWAIQKFGKLRLKDPRDLQTDSIEETEWVCECGKSIITYIDDVVDGQEKDCGRCDVMSAEWWGSKRFGKLRCKNPYSLSTKSEIMVTWVCECGKPVNLIVKDVVSGTVESCGSCDPEFLNNDCKSEIEARIEELELLSKSELPKEVQDVISSRISKLKEDLKTANEDIVSAAISSHHVMCKAKNMGYNDAFGNDPFIYYALGLVGEAGELTGALLRAIRNNDTNEGKRVAVESELADCIIYAVILAYTTGIDLTKIVNEKARIVEARAKAGYYGPPIKP